MKKEIQGVEYLFLLCNLPTYNESLILLVSETTIVQLKIEYKKITPIIILLRSEIELKIETKSKR